MIWVDFALIGVLAGFLAGFLGIGGGLVLVPALTLIFSRNPVTAALAVHMAVATSLSTMLVSSLSSILAHHRRRAIAWPAARKLTPGLLAGAVAGAMLADHLGKEMLAAVFGLFALAAGMQLIFGKQFEGEKPLPGWPGSSLTAMVIGCVSSLVGIGGGSMTAPWLMWHGKRAQNAVATAAACGYPIALAGTVSFVVVGSGLEAGGNNLGYVNLQAFAGITIFSVLAAPLGAAMVHRSPAGLVRRIFGLMMLVVAARMLM